MEIAGPAATDQRAGSWNELLPGRRRRLEHGARRAFSVRFTADQLPESRLVQERDPVSFLAQPLDLHELAAGVASGGLQHVPATKLAGGYTVQPDDWVAPR